MDAQTPHSDNKPQINVEELADLVPAPHALPTSLVAANRGAADIGIAQQLLAYGAQNMVVVFDTNEARIVHTLSGHKQAVTKVRWSHENYAKSFANISTVSAYALQLASADLSGAILVWDVRTGTVRCEFAEAGRGVQELCWLTQQDASKDLLLVLHAGNQMNLWNADTGSRIWSRNFSELSSGETLVSFTIDPFDARQCALVSDESIFLIDDLCVTRPPSRPAQRVFVIDTMLVPSGAQQQPATSANPATANNHPSSAHAPSSAPIGSTQPSSMLSSINNNHGGLLSAAMSDRMRKSASMSFGGVMPTSIQDAGRKLTKSAFKRVTNLFGGAGTAPVGLDGAALMSASYSVGATPNVELNPLITDQFDNLSLAEADAISASSGKLAALSSPTLVPQTSNVPVSTNGCVQVFFSRYVRYQLAVVYAREIVFIDLLVNLVVSSISIERNAGSPFTYIYSCSNDDALFCLHENATISYRKRRWKTVDQDHDQTLSGMAEASTGCMATPFTFVCASEHVRQLNLNKSSYRMASLCVNPLNERNASLIVPDGRVLVWRLERAEKALEVSEGNADGRTAFVLSGVHMPIASNAYAIRMCPPLTTKNTHAYQPLLAVGTTTGRLQVVHLVENTVVSDLQVLTSTNVPVRGIEWASLSSLVCFGFIPLSGAAPGTSAASPVQANSQSNTSSGYSAYALEPDALGRNELIYVDLHSNAQFGLRTTQAITPIAAREPPIELIRVNTNRHYLLVLVRARVIELWTLHSFRCLYELDCYQVPVLALDWAPPKLHGVKERFILADAGNAVRTITVQHQTTPNAATADVNARRGSAGFTNTGPPGGTITIREGRRVPLADAPLVRACALKDDLVVFGTADSLLQVWNYELRCFKNFPTSGRSLSVRKLRFSPGHLNHKLLVLDSEGLQVEVYEISCEQERVLIRCDLLGTLSFSASGKIAQRCIDADWVGSDTIALSVLDYVPASVFSTGSAQQQQQPHVQLRIYDSRLKQLNCELALRFRNERLAAAGFELADCGSNSTDALAAFNPYLLSADERHFSCARVFELAHACLFYGLAVAKSQSDHANAKAAVKLAERFESQLKPVLPAQLLSFFLDKSTRVIDRYVFMVQNMLLSGGEFELQFARLLAYYLQQTKAKGSATNVCPLSVDSLLNVDDFHTLESERLKLHEQLLLKSGLGAATSNSALEEKQFELVSRFLLISNNETTRVRAVLQTLLELNTPQSRDYLSNAYLACLLNCERVSADAQSCIKMVATNMIANHLVLDGVKLLCLIGKHADACRYLLSYNQADMALWLAKLCLPNRSRSSDKSADREDGEYLDVIRRVADYFWNATTDVNLKRKAVFLLLTIGDYDRVLECLYALKYYDVAYISYKLFKELRLVSSCSQLVELSRTSTASTNASATNALLTRMLIKLEYARILVAQEHETLAHTMLDNGDRTLSRLLENISARSAQAQQASNETDEQLKSTIDRIRGGLRELRRELEQPAE